MSTVPIPTICKICDEHCGTLVSNDGAKVTIQGNPDHPISKGFICIKGKNFGYVHHSPDRLKKPLLKKNSGWQEISFDSAMEILASKFLETKERFGPESVVFLKGEALKHYEIAQYMRHLANGFGSSNYMSIGSLCHFAQVLGHSLTYGGKPVPDFDRIGVVLLWGTNPACSSPRTFAELRKAVRRGTRLIAVDPATTQTTWLAHIHLQVRPGSDGFLALAFLKEAIEKRGLAPKDEFEEGWADLTAMIDGLSSSELLKKTDLGELQFNSACDLLFDNLPGWTKVGLGLEHRPGGVQTIRTTACLQSLLDPENRPSHMAIRLQPLPGADRYPPMVPAIGADRMPLFTNGRREGQGMLLTKAILHGEPYPVRAMLVAGSDPMLTFPAVQRQREALQNLDFLAVFDLFMTTTAQLADLIIPGADQLDNLELHDYGRIGVPLAGLMRPTNSSTVGMPTWKLIFDLAHRFGLEDLFPWSDNRDALSYRLSGSSVELSDLENSQSSTAAYDWNPLPTHHWHTKDGKVHYRSDALIAVGHPGLPIPEELELPHQTDENFPFWLSTGDRIIAYQHGQFRAVPPCGKTAQKPLLDIHPAAAARRNINSGERVILSTRYGEIAVQVNLNDDMREDCLIMLHGWEQANVNELTPLEHLDTVSGFPWFRSLPAAVKKSAGPS